VSRIVNLANPANLALAAVTAFFVLFPLTLGKPGLPTHLKADEGAYYLAAQSLAHDHNLKVEPRDVERAFEEFPFGPVNNMIVMTDDGWRTVYFGKPYIYSLAGAPFARIFGANGMLFFNMLMTMAMVWMGYLYLRRYNPPGLAALFSASFFLLSVGFSYVFWIQPEVFNMFSVAACLFFGLPRADETGLPDRRREWLFAFLSGAVLAFAVYDKPMFAAVGLAPLYAYLRERRWKTLAAWILGALLSMGAIAGLAVKLTGHPSAYLGVHRQGVTLCEPGKVPISPEIAQARGGGGGGKGGAVSPTVVPNSTTGNTWTWLFRPLDVTLYEEAENIGYFLVGRHTGMLVYTPFAALALIFFLLHGRRRAGERWVLLAAVTAIALYFLTFIAWNWQGGGGSSLSGMSSPGCSWLPCSSRRSERPFPSRPSRRTCGACRSASCRWSSRCATCRAMSECRSTACASSAGRTSSRRRGSRCGWPAAPGSSSTSSASTRSPAPSSR
jgi:hypothetical protein